MIQRLDPTPIMHRIVRSDGLLFIGGTTADDEALDMEGQARQAFAKLDAALNRAGSAADRLLSVTIYVTDLSLKPQMNRAWQDWLPAAAMPARATIGVADLGGSCLLELTAIARA